MKTKGVDVIAILGGAAVVALVASGCGDDIQTSLQKQRIIEAAEQESKKNTMENHQCGERWNLVAGLRGVLDTSSVRENILLALRISSTELYRLADEIRRSYTASACFVNTIIADDQRVETHWEVGQQTVGPWGCVENKHPERCNPYQPLYNKQAIISLDK